MNKAYKFITCLAFILIVSSCGSESGVSFGNLSDGDTVGQSVIVHMVVKGMDIEPAGPVIAGKGHHHIIIDGSFIPGGQPVPANPTHIHFGLGQTETTLNLSPGKHTLTLQFADGVHVSYGEKWSKTII